MEILLTAIVAGNFVGTLCASIIAYYQSERKLYRSGESEKYRVEISPDKSSARIDEELSAVEVAKYIIRYLHNRGYHINISTLGALLYFVQAQYAVEEQGKRCFKEKIVATLFGAEVLEVRGYFSGWGVMDIYPIWLDSLPISSLEEKLFIPINQDSRFKLIDLVLEGCIEQHNLERLSGYIRNQRPWKEARKTTDCVITVESLRDYFLE